MEAQRLCDRVGVMEQGRLVALGTPTELARELRHGVSLEIGLDAPPPDDGLARAGIAEKVSAIAWDETTRIATFRLHSEDAIPDLIEALVHIGARISRVIPQEPTLEDVYFAIHDEGSSEARA
jgi:ABC-2 type transport system ATP-binding protein